MRKKFAAILSCLIGGGVFALLAGLFTGGAAACPP